MIILEAREQNVKKYLTFKILTTYISPRISIYLSFLQKLYTKKTKKVRSNAIWTEAETCS